MGLSDRLPSIFGDSDIADTIYNRRAKVSLPYNECMRVYYSCAACGARSASRSGDYMGEPARLCDECYRAMNNTGGNKNMLVENKNTNYLRQVIVVRKDLCMPVGKLAAMVAHASMTWLTKRLQWTCDDYDEDYGKLVVTPDQYQWLTELDPGIEEHKQLSFAKIVLAVNSEEELINVADDAFKHDLPYESVYDCGYSHNKKGDFVAIAIGPARPEQLYPVTGHLPVYR